MKNLRLSNLRTWHARHIIRVVAEQNGMTYRDMLGKRRKQKHVDARNAVIIALRKGGFSFPEIGAVLNRDHSTIMHLLKHLENHERDNRRFDAEDGAVSAAC